MEPTRYRDASQVEYGELPELTRALRALGSARRSPGSLQSQFFEPLLDARRRAAEARSATACLRAFDSVALDRSLELIIDRIVTDWADARPSARRALRAELKERVGAYKTALSRLSEHAARVLSADEATRLESWRRWTAQLAATFEAADRSWMSLRTVVEALPKAR